MNRRHEHSSEGDPHKRRRQPHGEQSTWSNALGYVQVRRAEMTVEFGTRVVTEARESPQDKASSLKPGQNRRG